MATRWSWKDLQEAYLAFLSVRSKSDTALWLAVWQRFIEHPYYQRQARKTARATLRVADRPMLADLLAVAMMLLAKRIQAPCDTETTHRISHDFPGWLQAILVEDCQSAYVMPKCAGHQRRSGPIDPDVPDAIHIRAHELVTGLADPQRSVLLLHLSGFSPPQIAEVLELSQSHVDRLIHSGLKSLRSKLRR